MKDWMMFLAIMLAGFGIGFTTRQVMVRWDRPTYVVDGYNVACSPLDQREINPLLKTQDEYREVWNRFDMCMAYREGDREHFQCVLTCIRKVAMANGLDAVVDDCLKECKKLETP